MGLRNRTQQPFWRTTPIRSTDPGALYQHGIECVGKRDGKGMIATGWALCQVAGLHEHQAGDFLTDGYRIWRESPGFDRAQAAAFLSDLFGALCSLTPPSVPADIWSASPEAVMPASIYYNTRCWAGNELLEVAVDQETRAQYEPLVYRSAVEAPHDFVPTRSVDFAKSYAARNGLSEPWVIVLPGQREVVHAGASSGAGVGGVASPEHPSGPSPLTNYAPPPSGPASLTNYAPPEIGPASLTNYTAPPSGPQQLNEYSPPAPHAPLHDESSFPPPSRPGTGDEPPYGYQPEEHDESTRQQPQQPQQDHQQADAQQAAPQQDHQQADAQQQAAQEQQQTPAVSATVESPRPTPPTPPAAQPIPAAAPEPAATTEHPRPRPRPTPGPRPAERQPSAAPSPTVVSPVLRASAPAVEPPPAPAPQQQEPQQPQQPQRQEQPVAQAPAPASPNEPVLAPTEQPSGGWQPPASVPPTPPAPVAEAAPTQPEPASAAVHASSPSPSATPAPAHAQAPAPAERHDSSQLSVPPRLADLRSNLMAWLSASYRDVHLESNGWITIPDIGPSVIQIETSIIQGGHLKAEVFAPLVLDVPMSAELLRLVALEGGRFHFGVMSLDAGEDGTDDRALLQFSHSLLADSLRRDELLAVVWLVAATVVERGAQLQQRFGGVLFRDLNA